MPQIPHPFPAIAIGLHGPPSHSQVALAWGESVYGRFVAATSEWLTLRHH